MSAFSFRSAYGLPSHGISIRVITREMVTPQDFAFIGDSVGFSITDADTSELPALLDGVFASTVFDSVGGRCTASPNCIGTTGVQAAQAIPNATEVAIVELGYNDPTSFAGKIDQVMTALRAKGVSRVGWVTMSERRASSAAVFAAANQALNAARARWPSSSCSTGTRPAADPTATAGTPTASISPPPDSRSSRCGCAVRRSRWRPQAPASSAPAASCG